MSEIVINEKKLTVKESNRLAKLEEVIKENFLGFVAVGKALAEIREKRLYRTDDNRTFEGYCRDLWDMSHQHADRLVASANVLENLTPIGVKNEGDPNFVLPINEAQARELTTLEPNEQRAVWEEILDHRVTQFKKGQFPKVTAMTVKKAVLKFKGKKIEVQIDQSTKEPTKKSKDFASEEFVQAYDAFGEQIKAAQASSWRSTSRSKVFSSLSTLLDLVSKAGSKELKNNGCSMELSNREKLAKRGFRLFKMRPADRVIEEWHGGDTWMVVVSCDTPKQLSDAFKELMEDPKNLRA